MDLIEINKKLIGHIGFYGDTNYDKESLDSLYVLGDLLTYFTREVVRLKNDIDGRYEASAQELNKKAVYILESIIDEIGE